MKRILFITCFLLSIFIGKAQTSFFDKGLDAFEKENYKQAIALYTKQIKNKAGANVHYNRALAYYALQDYVAAIEDFTITISTDTLDYEALYNRGLAYFYIGDLPKAIEDSKKALKLNPNHDSALTTLGMCAYKTENYAEALVIFDSILRIKESSLSYYNRALTFNKLGKVAAAEKDFTHAISLEPNVRNYWGRADFYYNQKKYNQSVEDYTQALNIDSNSTQLYYNRALSYYANFKDKEAIEDLLVVVSLDSNNIDAKWYLCASYYTENDYEESLFYYNAVENQNPNYGLLKKISKVELERKTKMQDNLTYIVMLILAVIFSLFFGLRIFKKQRNNASKNNATEEKDNQEVLVS